jgi:hypothetical protein
MQNSDMFLELEGTVFVVTKDQEGNVLTREPLDSKIVLRALLASIEDGVKLIDPEKIVT